MVASALVEQISIDRQCQNMAKFRLQTLKVKAIQSFWTCKYLTWWEQAFPSNPV